ncbi:MAG: PhzF family phenazine biosynthesis protein [Chromatiales bacterium]|nr:PhzF family phenazine biosynthesis protein [Chromatiales bacterium]
MKIYHIDAFTDALFKGNPAGVVVLNNVDISDVLKQSIARELKHSETAFVLINDSGVNLRWFTPETEVDLCGHATIASAHILWESGAVDTREEIDFQTRSGTLQAVYNRGKVELDFPQLFVDECEQNKTLNEAFGIEPVYTGRNLKRYLLQIESPDDLRELQPDFELLKQVDLGAFMITCKSDRTGYDFLSRFFAPAVGIPEDPVTGSAHCYLAPHWSKILNKETMVGFQESSRTGIVECELKEDNRLKISGEAKTVFEAEMNIT